MSRLEFITFLVLFTFKRLVNQSSQDNDDCARAEECGRRTFLGFGEQQQRRRGGCGEERGRKSSFPDHDNADDHHRPLPLPNLNGSSTLCADAF